MKQENDGSYTATFDSQEMRDALQYMYDLKWKYNALPDDIAIDKAGLESMFGSDEVAMMIADPPTQSLTTAYDMNIDAIYADRVPAGPYSCIFTRSNRCSGRSGIKMDEVQRKGNPYNYRGRKRASGQII